MSELHKLELRTKFKGKAFAAGNAELLLDGNPLQGVRSVTFSAGLDGVATATIELLVAEFEAEGIEVKTSP